MCTSENLNLTLLTNYRWVMAKDFHIMEVDTNIFLMCGKESKNQRREYGSILKLL